MSELPMGDKKYEEGYPWPCIGCQRTFTPKFLPLIGRYARYCNTCGLHNLILGIYEDKDDRNEALQAFGFKPEPSPDDGLFRLGGDV